MAPSHNNSIHTRDLHAAFHAAHPNGTSPADKLTFGKNWMTARLQEISIDEFLLTGNCTIPLKTGQNVYEFVLFNSINANHPLYPNQPSLAFYDVQHGKLPSLYSFYLMFATISHMNDKIVDSDKICLPRQCRLDAIARELMEPGSTQPPCGFANDSKTAGWKHEVKSQWHLYQGHARKNGQEGKNGQAYAIALEHAYQIIAEMHVYSIANGEIKHRGRDATMKAVKDNFSEYFPTQIIKDFVASCPGCQNSTQRLARMQGAQTTRERGGNGAKRPARPESVME